MPDGASGQVERVTRRFALVAVAGELSRHYRLTGWPEGEASKAVGKCFASWLELFGGTGNQREERMLLAQVRSFFDTHGGSRFQDIEDESQSRLVINRAGFYRGSVGNWAPSSIGPREYLVLPAAFREMCAGFDTKFAKRTLIAREWLIPDSDGHTMQKPRLPGVGPTRVYVFGSRMWEGEE
jgi:uncharacterized protein (DUF927 family)